MNTVSKWRWATIVALLVGIGLLAGCSSWFGGSQQAEAPATVAPPTSAPVALAATLAPTKTATPRPTVTQTPEPSLTPRPTRTPTKAPEVTATTVGPKKVVITEADVAKFVSEGALAQYGANVRGLNVGFANGKMRLTADNATYGFVSLDNIDLVGRPVARNGVVTLNIESLSPGGFVSSMVPSMANQALAQYTSQWYVEDVKVLDGRVELTVR
ncbi:MAG: hypothetical protein U0641_09995 [Anaerolineae bacterium]